MPRTRSDIPRLRKATNLSYAVYFTKRDINIPSGEVQSLLRHYNFGSAALYKIGINLRKLGLSEEKVQETERLVYVETLKPLLKDLAEETARLERQFGLPKSIAESSKPFTATVEVQYAKANILLDLLLAYDQLLFHINQLHSDYKVVDYVPVLKMADSEWQHLTRTYGDRIKIGLKHIDAIARGAVKEASQLARKQKEDAEVEAGIKAMVADAAATEAPEGTIKATARRGRKTAETVVAPALDTKEEGQEKGPENPLMVSTEERAISPFEHIQ
jgi:hypothetical protein